jgi:glycine betaine/proline transport system substrate-binding protein
MTGPVAQRLLAIAIFFACGGVHAAPSCELERPIRFAGNDWASHQFNVALAGHILAKGYGCKVTTIPGTSQPLLNALAKGDVDVLMELWKENNVEIWAKMEQGGRAIETQGVSIQGAIQAWWVPRYLVEGDAGLELRESELAQARGLRPA